MLHSTPPHQQKQPNSCSTYTPPPTLLNMSNYTPPNNSLLTLSCVLCNELVQPKKYHRFGNIKARSLKQQRWKYITINVYSNQYKIVEQEVSIPSICMGHYHLSTIAMHHMNPELFSIQPTFSTKIYSAATTFFKHLLTYYSGFIIILLIYKGQKAAYQIPRSMSCKSVAVVFDKRQYNQFSCFLQRKLCFE